MKLLKKAEKANEDNFNYAIYYNVTNEKVVQYIRIWFESSQSNINDIILR